MATNEEQANVNALWARAQELLPGLRHAKCGGAGFCREILILMGQPTEAAIMCDQRDHAPDLALLLKAMREAGWLYSLMPAKEGAYCWFKQYWLDPNHRVTGPDELTAALQAAVAALEAERKENHG